MKNYLKVTVGSLVVAFAINLFIVPFNLVPCGIFGFSVIYHFKTGFPLALALLLINIICLSIGKLFFTFKEIKKAVVPSLLIPLFIWITHFFTKGIDITHAEMMLTCVYGGFIMGLGMKTIYSSGFKASGLDVIASVFKLIVEEKSTLIFYLLDILWLIVSLKTFGLETSMYTLISIIIMEVMRYRAVIGIGEAKVFYIITKEEKKVKDYMMNDLNLKITIFDAKGGFSKNKNRILMSVVPSSDYFKIREGIKKIDKEAFISITDTYESINSKLIKNI